MQVPVLAIKASSVQAHSISAMLLQLVALRPEVRQVSYITQKQC